MPSRTALVRAVGWRFWLWPEAILAAVASARRGWWRRTIVPLPDPGYLAWRHVTAYGSEEVPPDPGAVREFLRWRARQRRV